MNDVEGGVASAEFRAALDQAMALSRATGGTFDVSVGALAALWRAPVPPTPDAVALARDTLGAVAITGDRVVLGSGTRLDFDGFAKGVAVDACVAALRAAGVTRALDSFGESSLFALGAPRGARAWSLDVRGPDPDLVVARLDLRDAAAAVSAIFSGVDRRSGVARGHIVDPRSGMPLSDDAASLVVAATAAEAEAHGKAILVRGAAGALRDGPLAARITRDRVAMNGALRDAGILHVLVRPRRIPAEVALR